MTDQFELFISYSRRDDETGWVTGLRDFILADHRRFSSEPMRIFLDRSEIRTMDDWRHRILGALRSSNVLLVCQSPNYYRSAYCRWEFEEYLRMQARVPVGGDPIAVVYFVEVPGADPTIDQRWREEIARHHHVDLDARDDVRDPVDVAAHDARARPGGEPLGRHLRRNVDARDLLRDLDDLAVQPVGRVLLDEGGFVPATEVEHGAAAAAVGHEPGPSDRTTNVEPLGRSVGQGAHREHASTSGGCADGLSFTPAIPRLTCPCPGGARPPPDSG